MRQQGKIHVSLFKEWPWGVLLFDGGKNNGDGLLERPSALRVAESLIPAVDNTYPGFAIIDVMSITMNLKNRSRGARELRNQGRL